MSHNKVFTNVATSMDTQLGGRRRGNKKQGNNPEQRHDVPKRALSPHGMRQGKRKGLNNQGGKRNGDSPGHGKRKGRDAHGLGQDHESHAELDIHQLTTADVKAIMWIAKDNKLFKVDPTTWDCSQAGGSSALQKSNTRTLANVNHPDQAGPCDAHFDPQSGSGSKCGKRARCFQTALQDGADETVKQQMDSVATKTFVRQNLEDPQKFVSFLQTFNNAATNVLTQLCLSRGLKYGKDVVFAFKGGNVMRLVLLGVMSKLPPDFRSEWDDLMQIGDMDFEVFIDDATDQMVRDATVLMLYVIYAFRVFLQQGGWLLKGDAMCKQAMAVVVPAVTDIKTEGHDAHSDDSITVPFQLREGCDLLFVPVRSVLMKHSRNGSKTNWLETPARSDTPLVVSLNRSLSFGVIQKKGVAPEADIVLLRLKHGLKVVVDEKCARKASAEVIDVSIPTNKDRMHRIKSENKKINWFTDYEFTVGGETLRISAPSLDNFVLDLHMFMFVLSEYPWFDPKRAKRMKRYVWFCTMLRAQLGATPATIVSELGSLAKALSNLLKQAQEAEVAMVFTQASRQNQVTSSLATRVSPWAELLTSMETTRHKALDAGLGQKDWQEFVTDMRKTVMAVKKSFELLRDLPVDGQGHASKKLFSQSSRSSMLTKATLAMAAVSVSQALAEAIVVPPLS